MATIELIPHNDTADTWLFVWSERQEVIGRLRRDEEGSHAVTTYGAHWNPMKSFAGCHFRDPQSALAEVQMYFKDR